MQSCREGTEKSYCATTLNPNTITYTRHKLSSTASVSYKKYHLSVYPTSLYTAFPSNGENTIGMYSKRTQLNYKKGSGRRQLMVDGGELTIKIFLYFSEKSSLMVFWFNVPYITTTRLRRPRRHRLVYNVDVYILVMLTLPQI